MDPHTARCLQLSTSIKMPFSPHRPYFYSDSINRSRFPMTVSPQHSRTLSSTPLPARGWPTPIIQNIIYQDANAPAPRRQSVSVHQKPRVPTIHTGRATKSMDLRSPYYQSIFTSDERVDHDQWSQSVYNPAGGQDNLHNGLGLNFMDKDQDITPTAYSGTTVESFDELINFDDFSSWDFDAASPDRRSSSSLSVSSAEGIFDPPDFADLCNPSVLQSKGSSDLHMAFSNDQYPPSSFHFDTSRRSSRPNSHLHSTHPYRSSPYSINRTRSSSTSTGPISMPRPRCCSPLEEHYAEYSLHDGDYQTDQTGCTLVDNGLFDDFCFANDEDFARKQQFSSESVDASPSSNQALVPPILPSSSVFQFKRDDQSGDYREQNHGELADQPNLFKALAEEQLIPNAEDLNPEDPDLEPRTQELRFDGDLYTPRYVRGQGNKREGWCGICKPGRWLVLKNSAFWYDKSFTHGISAAFGTPFESPKETRRMVGNADVWEGLCGSCGEWIALISSKKKGTTWFRHAYKCHTHQRTKDSPKRRRESAQNRVPRSSYAGNVKHEPQNNLSKSLGSALDSTETPMEDDLKSPKSALDS